MRTLLFSADEPLESEPDSKILILKGFVGGELPAEGQIRPKKPLK